MDELTAAQSVTFNTAGDKIWAGYASTLRCWDVARPGRDCEQRSTVAKKSVSKKAVTKSNANGSNGSKGQKGIVSALAFCPDGSGLFAAGSYSKSICLYDER
jgi:telomerase Cajal body protein 1